MLGKYIKLLEDPEKRFDYCLKKRYPNYLIIEFEIFIVELFEAIKETKQKFNIFSSIDSAENLLIKELETYLK